MCQRILSSLWSAHHSTEERGGVSRAHKYLKKQTRSAEFRADFDSVKKVFFTQPLTDFNHSMLQTFH